MSQHTRTRTFTLAALLLAASCITALYSKTSPAFPSTVFAAAAAGDIGGMTVAGNYGYIADAVGLKVLDLSMASLPQMVGLLMTTTEARGLAVSGDYVYLCTNYNSVGLTVVDVSDKTKPTIKAQLFTSSGASAIALNTAGTRAYLGGFFTSASKLQIVDVSNPLAPVAQGAVTLPSSPQDVIAQGNYVYCAMGSGGLTIIDVSNPAAPSLVVSSTLGGLTVSRLAYLTTDLGPTLVAPTGAGLKIINVTTPASPVVAATAYAATAFLDVVSTGAATILASNSTADNAITVTLQAINLATVGSSPPVTSSLSTAGRGNRISYHSTTKLALFTTTGSDASLSVVDATSTLTRLAKFPRYSSAMFCDARSGETIQLVGANQQNNFGGNKNAIFWVDWSNPYRPVVLSQFTQGDLMTAVALSDNGRFGLVGIGGTVKIVDLSAPALAGQLGALTGAWSGTGTVQDIKVRNNIAYVAANYEGLRIIDLSADGKTPKLLGSIGVVAPGPSPGILGLASSVELVGNYAYVTSAAPTAPKLYTIDISNPASPSLVSTSGALPAPATSVFNQGNKLYVSCASTVSGNGLTIFDISAPASPVKGVSLSTPGYARKVSGIGTLIYIASDTAGIVMVDCSNPAAPVMVNGVKTASYCRDVKSSGNLVFYSDDAALAGAVLISPAP